MTQPYRYLSVASVGQGSHLKSWHGQKIKTRKLMGVYRFGRDLRSALSRWRRCARCTVLVSRCFESLGAMHVAQSYVKIVQARDRVLFCPIDPSPLTKWRNSLDPRLCANDCHVPCSSPCWRTRGLRVSNFNSNAADNLVQYCM